jgi:Aspartyl protease
MFQSGLSSRFWIRFVLSAILTAGLGAASTAAASDVRFTSGHSALKIPFRLYNNHIYLHVAVNGSAPLWFVLDTGAPNLIASKHSQALRLKLTPAGQAGGNGDNTQDAFYAENVSFTLPGVKVTGQKFGVIDFERLEECSNEIDVDTQGNMIRRDRSRKGDERQPFDGVIGDEFFRLFVVEIDYAAQVMNLYEPESYQYKGRGEAVPLETIGRYVYVRTQLTSPLAGTVKGLFLIDTGHMGALLLHRPFVETRRLLPPDEKTKPFELCGIGGYSKARIGPLQSLRLGTAEIEGPVTMFSQATGGNLISTDYDGIIGSAILHHFTVVFDYSRSRMYLESPVKK